MNFDEIQLGGPGQDFAPSGRFRVPFAFSTDVGTAHPVLQSFHLEVRHSDSHVRDVAVSLTPIFDPVQSARSGEVDVEIQRTGSDGNILSNESDSIRAQVRILVVGL